MDACRERICLPPSFWGVNREDNGSLPFNILSVGDAMLDWGLCPLALESIGFYFQNCMRWAFMRTACVQAEIHVPDGGLHR